MMTHLPFSRLYRRAILAAFVVLALGAGMNDAQAACANPTGAAGDMIYNTDYNTLQFCNDTSWVRVGGSSGGSGGSTTLAALTDVTVGTPTDGQALVWNNTTSKWVPGTVSGGGGGAQVGFMATKSHTYPTSYTAVTGFTEIRDDGSNFDPSTGIFTAPSAGYYEFTATSFINSVSGYADIDIFTSTSTSVCRGFEAPGSANYYTSCHGIAYLALNETVRVAVSNGASATGTVSFRGIKLGSGGSGGSSTLAGLTDITIGTPTNGQALVYNSTSSKWEPGTVSGSGSSAQGAFAAYQTASQSLPAATNTKTTFEVERFDTDNYFDLATDRFTPTSAGKYMLSFTTAGAVAASGGLEAAIFKNGAIYAWGSFSYSAIGGNNYSTVNTVVDANGTDYFEFYTWSSASQNTSPAAQSIYVSGFKIGGGGSGSSTLAGLTDITIGTPTNGQALVYNSTSSKWEPGTVAAGGTAVGFYAYKASGDQTTSGLTAVTFDTTVFNAGSGYNTGTSRFTAPVAGNYVVSGAIDCGTGTNSVCRILIYKNGTEFASNQGPYASNYIGSNVTAIVPMAVNDYVQIYSQASVTNTVRAAARNTHFSAGLLGGGGSGGSSTLAGLTDITYGTPTNGQSLVYNSTTSKWVPTTISGGGSVASGRAWRSTSFSLTANTWTDIPLVTGDAVLSGVTHSTSTNPERLTVTAAGTYFVSYGVGTNHNGLSTNYAQLAVNGTAVPTTSAGITETAAVYISSMSRSAVLALNAGDYITVQANVQNAGSAVTDATLSIISVGSGGGSGSSTLAGLTDITYGTPTNGQSLVYNSGTSKWVPTTLAAGASAQVAFSVHRNAVDQTVTNGGYTALVWTTEAYDTNNNFNTGTGRFTPTVAGKYIINLNLLCSDGTTYCAASLYKNGTQVNQGFGRGTGAQGKLSVIVDMNGSTDYLEAYANNGGGVTVDGRSLYTNFTGMLLNGGGSGGSSTLAGLTDITYGTPTNGQALVYNSTSSKWEPGTVAGGGAEVSFTATGSTQTMPNNAWTDIINPTQKFDIGGDNYNTTTGKFTAPSAGRYLFSATANTYTASGNAGVLVQVADAGIAGNRVCMSYMGAGGVPSCAGVIDLTAGQVVEVAAFQNAGGTPALPGGDQIIFSGYKLAGSGGSGSSTLAGLTDITIGTPTNGQALVYNSTSSKWEPGTIAAGGGAGQSLSVTRSTSVNYTAVGDVILDTKLSGNIPFNTSTGVATLTSGKTYLFVYSVGMGGGSNPSDQLHVQPVDATSNAVLIANEPRASAMQIVGQNGYQGNGSASFTYTPSTNQTVKLRVVGQCCGDAITLVNNNTHMSIIEVGSSNGSGSSTLAGLTDITIGTPTNGQALVYNSTSSKWEPGTVAAGGTEVSFKASSSSTSMPTAGTWYDIVQPTQAYDNGGDNYNPTTGKFTAPSAGTYVFTANLNPSTASGIAGVIVQTNDASTNGTRVCFQLSPATGGVVVTCSGSIALAAGQVVEMIGYSSVGSAASAPADALFSGFKVGNGGGGSASAAGAVGALQFAGASNAFAADATTLFWDNTNKRLGIGTATPNVALDVAGAIVSRGTDLSNGTTVNFTASNVAYTGAACGAFTLSGMQDGGSYTLIVKGNGTGPATFTHAGMSVKTTGTLNCMASKHSVFTFIRAGTDVYVTYITGY